MIQGKGLFLASGAGFFWIFLGRFFHSLWITQREPRICVEIMWNLPFEEIRMGAENYNRPSTKNILALLLFDPVMDIAGKVRFLPWHLDGWMNLVCDEDGDESMIYQFQSGKIDIMASPSCRQNHLKICKHIWHQQPLVFRFFCLADVFSKLSWNIGILHSHLTNRTHINATLIIYRIIL